MKITILGCGTSGGVPQVGLGWGDCDPNEPRNRRKRASILVEEGGQTILVDTGPDCREQLLFAEVQRLDAIFYTHAHADHCHGIDDLRWLCHAMGEAIEIYGDKLTLEALQGRFDYCFTPLDPRANRYYYKPVLNPNVIQGPVEIGPVTVKSFDQDHGHSISLGFRFGDFAYSTDVVRLNDAAFEALEGVDTWVVDALQHADHPTHANLEQALAWIERVKPRRAILTHMNTRMDYQWLVNNLPDGVEPAYDGMILEI